MRRPPSAPDEPQVPVRRSSPHDHGFTLVELMVALAVFGVVAAFGVGALRSWQIAEAHRGAATSLQTLLRQTQVRAVTEGVNFCVTLDTGASASYTVHRYACSDTAKVEVAGPYKLGDPRLQLAGPASVGFRPSGSASPATLTLTRPGSSKTYELKVEGLTGRVSLS